MLLDEASSESDIESPVSVLLDDSPLRRNPIMEALVEPGGRKCRVADANIFAAGEGDMCCKEACASVHNLRIWMGIEAGERMFWLKCEQFLQHAQHHPSSTSLRSMWGCAGDVDEGAQRIRDGVWAGVRQRLQLDAAHESEPALLADEEPAEWLCQVDREAVEQQEQEQQEEVGQAKVSSHQDVAQGRELQAPEQHSPIQSKPPISASASKVQHSTNSFGGSSGSSAGSTAAVMGGQWTFSSSPAILPPTSSGADAPTPGDAPAATSERRRSPVASRQRTGTATLLPYSKSLSVSLGITPPKSLGTPLVGRKSPIPQALPLAGQAMGLVAVSHSGGPRGGSGGKRQGPMAGWSSAAVGSPLAPPRRLSLELSSDGEKARGAGVNEGVYAGGSGNLEGLLQRMKNLRKVSE
jgi:hypothetical protein